MGNAPIINAIPTTYNGISFRSRTEARWAVFFDVLSVSWQYETEGYISPSGSHYLPDFWLPQFDMFFEVKGTAGYDEKKIEAGVEATGKTIVVAPGPPSVMHFSEDDGLEIYRPYMAEWGAIAAAWDSWYAFGRCPHGHLAFQFEGDHTSDRHCVSAQHTLTPMVEPGDINRAIGSAMAHRFWNPGGVQ